MIILVTEITIRKDARIEIEVLELYVDGCYCGLTHGVSRVISKICFESPPSAYTNGICRELYIVPNIRKR